jgi:uncharacterized radical SAM superfamily Fe-S cluster-containing enzyme
VLRDDGKLIPTTHFELAQEVAEKDAAARSKDYVRRHWKYYEPTLETVEDESQRKSADPFERIKSHSLCISGMAFQDAWNIDLERLQRCCIHVATLGGKLIPFCIYYLTSSSRKRLVYGERVHLGTKPV